MNRAARRTVETNMALHDPVAARRPAPVLLVLPDATGSPASVRRAHGLARALGVELWGLVLTPSREPFTLPLSERAPMLLARARGCMTRALGADVCVGFRLRSGPFIHEVIACARELTAGLIVVSPPSSRSGWTTTKLARLAGIPVLVARDAAHEAAIVAATDLADPCFPVLRSAISLTELLAQRLVIVHNRPRRSSEVVPEPTRWRACLTQASDHIGARAISPLLCADSNPTDAILRAAQSHDADLVVVGTHPRGIVQGLLHRSVATQVVNRSRRSVLVTPLSTPAPQR